MPSYEVHQWLGEVVPEEWWSLEAVEELLELLDEEEMEEDERWDDTSTAASFPDDVE